MNYFETLIEKKDRDMIESISKVCCYSSGESWTRSKV